MTAPSSFVKPVALKIEHLRKAFGGTVALDDFSIEVNRGEIHSLIGQNGSGKSTVVKSLTGVLKPDGGLVTLFGRRLDLPILSPATQGIAVIHQDIGIVGTMTVLENLGVVAGYGTRMLSPIQLKRERAVYLDLMNQLGISLNLDARAGTLSPAGKTFLGVVRAMRIAERSRSEHLLILDEPTAALSKPEAGKVLALMRRIADLGAAVIFISHRISEIFEGERVTVMRTGRDIAHLRTADATRSELLALMLGNRLDDMFPSPPDQKFGPPRIATHNLSGKIMTDVNLKVHAGEVVGIAGLAGMGQEELPFLLSGAARPNAGGFALDGGNVSFCSSKEAIAAGVVLVPRDRIKDGVWSSGTAEENLSLPVIRQYFTKGWLRRSRLRLHTIEKFRSVFVRPQKPDYPMAAFSGGNQQKIVFAKWLQLQPRVLLLDEPTQGVDPGAARQLLDLTMAAAASGGAVLILSGDYELLATVCHRVVVVQNGRIASELGRAELSEHAIMEASDAVPQNQPVPT